MNPKPAVWLPTVRANSGADVFTIRLQEALEARDIPAEITWLPLRAEYAPWTVAIPQPPPWANIVHVNTWLHRRFIPSTLPVVATLHSCVHDRALEPYKSRRQAVYHRNWIRRLESRNLQHATAVTAVSHYTADVTRKLLDREDIVVITNGVDTRVFSPMERMFPHRPFRLLYVGNWSSLKGVDLLGPIMRDLGEGFELLFTEDRALRQQRFALPPNCRSIGRPQGNHAMARWYRDSDALLFPSRVEGFGLVAAEAMACGRPVIATNCTSIPDIVVNGECGILCRADDVAAFVRAARELSASNELWRQMCLAARQRAELFSEERAVSEYVHLYQRLLSQAARP